MNETPNTIKATGGFAKSEVWRQMTLLQQVLNRRYKGCTTPLQVQRVSCVLFDVTMLSQNDVLTKIASRVKPGADGLIFHPYLAGERAPLWNGE
jgi:sugar (pentulose or hexulose) kinase